MYYFNNDLQCQKSIESWFVTINFIGKHNNNTNNDNNNVAFKGVYLKDLSKENIKDIGITLDEDIEMVFTSIQSLININTNDTDTHDQTNDKNTAEKANSIEELLKQLNLSQYFENFKNEGFDDASCFQLVKELSDSDLKNDLNIKKKAHRMKI